MNISSLGNVPNITNQITTGAPQAGLRCDPSAAVRSAGKGATRGMDISGLGTLKNIDEAARQGYREDYSIRDAADALWRKETQTFNLKDLDDPEKSKEFLENWRIQARWDLGIRPHKGRGALRLHKYPAAERSGRRCGLERPEP